MDFTSLSISVHQNIPDKVNGWQTAGEIITSCHYKRLISKIFKELLQINKKKTENPKRKMSKQWKDNSLDRRPDVKQEYEEMIKLLVIIETKRNAN